MNWGQYNPMVVSWVIGVPPVFIHFRLGFSKKKNIHFGDSPFMETSNWEQHSRPTKWFHYGNGIIIASDWPFRPEMMLLLLVPSMIDLSHVDESNTINWPNIVMHFPKGLASMKSLGCTVQTDDCRRNHSRPIRIVSISCIHIFLIIRCLFFLCLSSHHDGRETCFVPCSCTSSYKSYHSFRTS